ncbi:hypothetical protein PR202_gb10390 [Eleusine coracana subsp. coracana]|uniref:Uncharacterized protein n=1 Tax=Eleusine coracana subsp. coracana TaxID=191504 RepID=A0AAV5EJV2_ELECO|nr:hypothetical protein PR202_gb10390 [Eleusine coracana subsp. coracana]
MMFSDEQSSNLVDLNESNGFRPKSPVLCKPSIEAMEAAIRIANVDPKKTVGRSTIVPGADHELESIHNIKEALPDSPRYGMVRIGLNMMLCVLPLLWKVQLSPE